MPTSFPVRAFLVVGRASLRLKTASAVGAIDCFLRLANASSRHLRLLFRLVRTGICTPSSIRREPPFATIRPPIRGLMNARNFACGTRFHLSPRAGCRRLYFQPTRHNVGQWLFTAHSILRSASPVIAKSEHRCSRPRFAYGCEHRPLRLGEAIDCSLRLHYAFRRHPSCVGGWLAPLRLHSQTIFDGYTALRCQLATSVCFSDSSMPLTLHSELQSRIAILRHCASHP